MLKKLEALYGVSGLENPVREYLIKEITQYCDRVWTDSMGSLHAVKTGKSDRTLLLAAYMDEPGIIITKITEDGYLKFETVGRLKPEFLVSKRVYINGHIGIISLKAVHLVTKKERETPVKLSQLFVDIGASTREEANAVAEIGDYGALCTEFSEFGDKFIKGRALAGRIGCAVAAGLLKETLNCNLHVIFAVQREIGCRGMIAAAYGLKADAAIVLDATETGTGKDNDTNAVCGGGAVLLYRMGEINPDRELSELIAALAEQEDIPIQTGAAKESGQEAVLSRCGGNMRLACLNVPVRYSQSPVEVACIKDMEALRCILKRLIVD